MDEMQLYHMIANCPLLKYENQGVFASDNFPTELAVNTFIIVNASNSYSPGTHWVLLANIDQKHYFADPLCYPLQHYRLIYKRILAKVAEVREVLKNVQLQPIISQYCNVLFL